MNIGLEIEFTGLTRYGVAEIIYNKIGRPDSAVRESLNKNGAKMYSVESDYGIWCINRDTSIKLPPHIDGLVDSDMYRCELITPVLKVAELCVLYDLLECISEEGGIVNDSCGVHIHIDYVNEKGWVYKLFKKLYSLERNNILGLYCHSSRRRDRYCKSVPECLYEEILQVLECGKKLSGADLKDKLLELVYNYLGQGESPKELENPARYYWVNFDSVYKRNTVEFRLFDSSLERSVVKSYVTFVVNLLTL